MAKKHQKMVCCFEEDGYGDRDADRKRTVDEMLLGRPPIEPIIPYSPPG